MPLTNNQATECIAVIIVTLVVVVVMFNISLEMFARFGRICFQKLCFLCMYNIIEYTPMVRCKLEMLFSQKGRYAEKR